MFQTQSWGSTVPGSSMFGGSTPPSTGGSLFGQTSGFKGIGQAQPTTGMFGGTAAPANGGMFGSSAGSPNTGMFGGPSSSSGGLFGSKPVTTSFGGSGGMLGGVSSGPFVTGGQGGIFGSPSPSGSIFGQSQAQQVGMFGQQQQASMFSQQTQPTSIFGGGTQPATGQMFGSSPTSMFGSSVTSSAGMFGGSGGSTSLFGQSQSGTGIAGQSAFGSAPSFGGTLTAGGMPMRQPFKPTISRNQGASDALVACITNMQAYFAYSKEELRALDYKKGLPHISTWGQTATGTFGQAGGQPTGGLFQTSTGSSMFGQQQTQGGMFQGQSEGMFGSRPQGLFQTGSGPFASQAQPTSLFGAQPHNTLQGAGGGLFSQQPAQGGGLFGQTPAISTGGGLFGQAQPTTSVGLFGQSQPSTSGGLFGQPTQSGGGMFNQTQNTTSGLFGQQQAGTGGSVFGASQASSGGLFGQAQSATGGGLFGQAQPSQSQPTSGGLFGQTQTVSGGGSLFGQAPTSNGGGLFGQTQPSSGASGGLFGQSQPAASASGFGQAQSNTGLFGQSPTATSGGGLFGQSQPSSGLFGQPASTGGLFGQAPQTGLFGQSQPSAGLFGSTQPTAGGLFGSATGGSLFASQLCAPLLSSGQGYFQQQVSSLAQSFLSVIPDGIGSDIYNSAKYFLQGSQVRVKKSRGDDPFFFNPSKSEADFQNYSLRQSKKKTDAARQLVVNRTKKDKVKIDQINRRSSDQTYSSVMAGIMKESASVAASRSVQSHTALINPSLIPVIPRGYWTKPSQTQLARMSQSEMKRVENFTIENEHGSITYLLPINLTGLNLQKIVEIKESEILIYKEEAVPPKGVGLNNPCVLRFNNIGGIRNKYHAMSKQKLKDFEDKLDIWMNSHGMHKEQFKPEEGLLVTRVGQL